jgi:hypothetical protein
MDYWEACETIVSRCEAKREIEKHNTEFDEFVEIHGDCEEYNGRDVLNFLGY